MNNSQRTRIAHLKKLAKELPEDLDNRDILYEAYMDHIEKIRKEKDYE